MWSEVRFISNMESNWMNKRMINWNEQFWLWLSGLFSSDLCQWWSRGKEVCLLRQPVSWREVAGWGGADAHHVVMLRPHADGPQDHEEEKNHRRNQSTTWYLQRQSGQDSDYYLWIWLIILLPVSNFFECLLSSFCDISRTDHGSNRGFAETLHFISGGRPPKAWPHWQNTTFDLWPLCWNRALAMNWKAGRMARHLQTANQRRAWLLLPAWGKRLLDSETM